MTTTTTNGELEAHSRQLAEAIECQVSVLDADGRHYVIIEGVPLPARFAIPRTDVLFIAMAEYPLAALDMFWTNPEAVLADGRPPANAELLESYVGREWRRYSWHRQGPWNPARNGLLDHFAFTEHRLHAELQ